MPGNATLVTIGAGRMPFACNICRGNLFTAREVKINTTGAELFNFGWANRSANGLVCARCGYLHQFVTAVEYWDPAKGYPQAKGWE
jgi:hypothetical protein